MTHNDRAMDDNARPPDAQPPLAPAPAASASPAAPAAPSAPWDGPAPDAVAWLLVNWHNKHPLARRISIQDVHTVGAVALPFLAQPLPKEPSLDAPGGQSDAQAAPKPGRRWPWQRRKASAAGPRRAWSEAFIPGLKPDQIAAMALDHGFTSAPDELPLRRVDISNSELESGGANQSGAWPMELVLLSAAIDAGPARTRVLVGRRDKVLGRRALDPLRLGGVAAVAVLLLALLAWALWPASAPQASPEAPASAASAASAASVPAAAAPDSAAPSASGASAAASPASTAASDDTPSPADAASAAAAAPEAPASAAASSAPAASGSVDLPFGQPRSTGARPSLQSGVERMKQEQGQSAPAESGRQNAETKPQKEGQKEGQKGASGDAPNEAPGKPGSGAASAAADNERRLNVDDAGLGSVIKRASPGERLVALVGLPQKTKPEAEAQLAKMQEMVGQTLRGGNTTVNGAVFQTKEGWRAAVWPFGSREEAQLINATLLARGMRARAVDF